MTVRKALTTTFLTAIGLCVALPASGLNIIRLNRGGTAPSVSGGGNLPDIFNAAADWWEHAVRDDHSVIIRYEWVDLDSGTLGITSGIFDAPMPTSVRIHFDNSGTSWFADPTPLLHDEYSNFEITRQDLGGGTISTGKILSGASGAAAGDYDLFTVALHEIGHALGFIDNAPTNFFTVPTMTVSSPLPFSGSVIPTTTDGGGHLELPNALFSESVSRSTRELPSNADMLALAQSAGYEDVLLMIRGDLNGDNSLTNADISALVLALTDPAGYAAAHPGLDSDLLGDFNGDGLLTNADISPFVDELAGGGAASAVPEPGAFAALTIASLMLVSRRRR